jgi:hypothetical protein
VSELWSADGWVMGEMVTRENKSWEMLVWKEHAFEDRGACAGKRTGKFLKTKYEELRGRTSESLIEPLRLPESLLRRLAGAGRLVQLEGGPDKGVERCLDLASNGDSGPRAPGVLGSCRNIEVLLESVLDERESTRRR